jgi:hypothetical protein
MGKAQEEYYCYTAYNTKVSKKGKWRTEVWKTNITVNKGLFYFKETINGNLFYFCLKIRVIMCHREGERYGNKLFLFI